MLNHKLEGLPICGKLYPKRQAIIERLELNGPAVIHSEIAELWQEIQIRTDVLAEHEEKEQLL
jgi:hypothetical protein